MRKIENLLLIAGLIFCIGAILACVAASNQIQQGLQVGIIVMVVYGAGVLMGMGARFLVWPEEPSQERPTPGRLIQHQMREDIGEVRKQTMDDSTHKDDP